MTLGNQAKESFLMAGLEDVKVLIDWAVERGDKYDRVKVSGHFKNFYLVFKSNGEAGIGYRLTINPHGEYETQILQMVEPSPENIEKCLETAKFYANFSQKG